MKEMLDSVNSVGLTLGKHLSKMKYPVIEIKWEKKYKYIYIIL